MTIEEAWELFRKTGKIKYYMYIKRLEQKE